MKKGHDIPQIFAGQTFILVPNNDRAVPRKWRINKAVQHGATWARAWKSSVTLVIVEDEQSLEDLVKVISQQVLSKDIALVLHTLLTESLGYKEMGDIRAGRFQVKFTSKLVTQTESPEGSFDGSLIASSPPTASTAESVLSVNLAFEAVE